MNWFTKTVHGEMAVRWSEWHWEQEPWHILCLCECVFACIRLECRMSSTTTTTNEKNSWTSAKKKWDIDREWNLNYSTKKKHTLKHSNSNKHTRNKSNQFDILQAKWQSCTKTPHSLTLTKISSFLGKIKIFGISIFGH